METLPKPWLDVVPELAEIAQSIHQQLEGELDPRPSRGLWYEALRRVTPEKVSVVLLGQDPYHGEDRGLHQAHGLAFSVPECVRPPPSLRNILTELSDDTGAPAKLSGDLSSWANQGVLLLNAALSTQAGSAGAHRNVWKPFTSALLGYLGRQEVPLVFILWGADAQKYKDIIAPHHILIESVHPSPLSSYRGFFGSRPFSRCNAALAKLNRPSVIW